jgi:hypothetical protein
MSIIYVGGRFRLGEGEKGAILPCRPRIWPMTPQHERRRQLIPEATLDSAVIEARDDEAVGTHPPRRPQ